MKWQEILALWWQQQQRFLPELRAQAKRYEHIEDASSLPQRVLEQSAPIFVLSTGRAGTQYLTNLFGELPGFHAEHEPQPELLYTSRWAYEHRSQSNLLEAAFLAARYELLRNAYLANQRYVETNNRLSFLAAGIAQCLPNAKFIHLVRHPEAFVRSGLQRRWYSNDHLTDEGRLQVPHALQDAQAEEKIAWLWNETNTQIAAFGDAIGSKRFLELQSEQLFKEIEVNKVLFTFLESAYPGEAFIRQQQAQPKNKSRKNPEKLVLSGRWKAHVPFAESRGYLL